jgi:SAM-dependent methyltransferase
MLSRWQRSSFPMLAWVGQAGHDPARRANGLCVQSGPKSPGERTSPVGATPLSKYYGDLTCPRCLNPVAVSDNTFRCTSVACLYSAEPFPTVAAMPALFDFQSSIISAEQLIATSGAPQIPRGFTNSRLGKRLNALLHPPNLKARKSISYMLDALRQSRDESRRPVVLVIGGATVGAGLSDLYDAVDIDVLAFDIYGSPVTQFMADAHRIPLADATMDAVVIQAVLEHVLEPQVVVHQIHRVLKHGGLVYADTPFLQHVHGGPYDFTRFTDSGHRYLLRDFECIESGVAAGAGTQLMWSIDYFMRALTRSRKVGFITRMAVFWLAYIDRFLDPKHSIDSASSVYFLGSKTNSRVAPLDMIQYYQGAEPVEAVLPENHGPHQGMVEASTAVH